MAPNDNETVPGFTLQSPHFMVKFLAGFQKGLVSEILKYETDWMEVMVIILDMLEMFPNSVKSTQNFMASTLENWISSQPGAEHLNIKANAILEEKVFFTPPLGSKKSLKISFTDNFKTEVLFHIKKRTTLKSLKDLCSSAVVDNLKTKEDIDKLEIPISLIDNLVQEFGNDWSSRYHRNNINCCKGHKGGIRKFIPNSTDLVPQKKVEETNKKEANVRRPKRKRSQKEEGVKQKKTKM